MDSILPSQALPYQFKDPRQQEIYESLNRLISSGIAEYYKDACKLMDDPEALATTAHLVAHLLREIESAIRSVLISTFKVSLGNTQKGTKGRNHREEIRAILAALNVSPDGPLARRWLELAGCFHRFAHRDALHPPRRATDEEFEKFWDDIQDVLSGILKVLQDHYASALAKLDELLQNPSPKGDDFSKLRNEIPYTPVTRNYFFRGCHHPKWIEYLEEEAAKVPLLPLEVEYLKEMVGTNPEGVSQVLLRALEEQKQDWKALALILETINSLPGELSARFSPYVKQWTAYPDFITLWASDLGVFVLRLAQNGFTQEAREVVDSVLRFLVGLAEGTDSPRSDETMRLHAYQEIFRKYFPDLARHLGFDFLRLLGDILTAKLTQEYEEPAHESSEVWRPMIAKAPQHSTDDFLDTLIDDVCEVAGLLITESLASLQETLGYLESNPWPLFRRIALHLLRTFPERDLVASHLQNPSILRDQRMFREYGLLLQKQFSGLSEEEQGKILRLIAEGPGSGVSGLSEEEKEICLGVWQRNLLYWIKDFLSGEWQERYRELVAKYGEPEELGSPEFIRVGWGPKGPKSAEELRKMSVEEVIDFLKTWEPTPGRPLEIIPPSPEGLGRELQKVVAQEPERFAAKAYLFQGLDPTYVRALLAGLGEAASSKKTFPWEPVLSLCLWVVEQPRDIEGRGKPSAFLDVDPHWGWTRTEIARLIATGLKRDLVEFSLRERVWQILAPLTEDIDPVPKYEEIDRDRPERPLEIAINSTRGEALEAVFHYAFWIRRNLKEQEKETPRQSLDIMPEVREVLEKHLTQDPSLTIRSLYGFWFPWITSLDPGWAKEKVSLIFPAEESQKPFFDASWAAYIMYHSPHPEALKFLRQRYALAIERMGEPKNEGAARALEGRLGEHLLLLYGMKAIDLEDPLLSRFFEKASPSLQKRTLEFIGKSVWNKKEIIPPETLERFKRLWEWYMELAEHNPQEHQEGLSAFGWWFISGKFDDKWAVDNLSRVLDIAKEVEAAERVIQRLAEFTEQMPLECVRCLRKIVEGKLKGWEILFAKDSIRHLLSQALKSEDSEAAQEARKLVSYLCSWGYTEFRELL
jgi:hypothetical protein